MATVGVLIAAPATAAASSVTPPKGLVSPRYQPKSCDTAVLSAAAAGEARALTAYRRELGAVSGNAAATAVRPAVQRLQYQSRNSIPHSAQRDSNIFQTTHGRSLPGSCAAIASSIGSSTFETSLPQDGRRLLQIAVAFAIAYVVFLTVWFWSTRERRTRVGRAARS